ncbi:hypothetical protein [Komagataeibacter xylinus]|uniref:hypothetical protein n=1 Tax=Komagataeibacter xylinus TaxID=28448 RepID=UPI00132F898C|nr:hypothetical protein [Komagataeibacter xylinus]
MALQNHDVAGSDGGRKPPAVATDAGREADQGICRRLGSWLLYIDEEIIEVFGF